MLKQARLAAQEETQAPQQRLEETQESRRRLQVGLFDDDRPDRDDDDDDDNVPEPAGLAAAEARLAAAAGDGPNYWPAGRQVVPAAGPDGRGAATAAVARAQSGRGQGVVLDRALREAFEDEDSERDEWGQHEWGHCNFHVC